MNNEKDTQTKTEIHKNFFNIEIYFRDTDKKHVIETRWKDVYFKISENQI